MRGAAGLGISASVTGQKLNTQHVPVFAATRRPALLPQAHAKAVRGYYPALAQLANVGAAHESAVRAAFDILIEAAASPLGWTLVREYAINRRYKPSLRLDGSSSIPTAWCMG